MSKVTGFKGTAYTCSAVQYKPAIIDHGRVFAFQTGKIGLNAMLE